MMEDNSVWPPPPSNQNQPEPAPKKARFSPRFLLVNIGLGIVLALFDITQVNAFPEWMTEGAAAILGFVKPRSAWMPVFIFTLSLYVIHVIAIQHGIKYPFVETDIYRAISCWEMLIPIGFWAFVGAMVKLITKRLQRKRTTLDT